MMLISPQHKAVFYLVEKCASGSLMKTLGSDPDWCWVRGPDRPHHTGELAFTQDYKKYAIVRNPFDRLVSYWAWRLKLNQTKQDFGEFCLDQPIDLRPITVFLDLVVPTHRLLFENIDLEFRKLPFVADGMRLAWENVAKHAEWLSYYQMYPEVIPVVKEWAEPDCERYGYSLDPFD